MPCPTVQRAKEWWMAIHGPPIFTPAIYGREQLPHKLRDTPVGQSVHSRADRGFKLNLSIHLLVRAAIALSIAVG
jgi:hypothetical protein